ncbi:MAG: rod shape-determining protein MreC, partial [Alphaproteobacteria bacterium]
MLESRISSRRRRRLSRWQRLLRRLFAAGLILAALSLIVLSRVRPEVVESLRAASYTVLSPALEVAAMPVRLARRGGDWVNSYLAVRRRNRALAARLADQQALERTIVRLQIENDRLRELLKVTSWPVEVYGTVRVIGAGGGGYVRSVLVDAGTARHLSADMAAVDSAGVVGRIIHAGRTVSRVLLLTDLNSKIPVRLVRTDETAILAGNNGPLAKLMFLALGSDGAVGDIVVTSGHGGVFPPDLPVGVIVAKEQGTMWVRPYAQ